MCIGLIMYGGLFMYVDPYDECRVVRQQELKTNVGKVLTLREYRVYPNFLRKYYVIDIDGVEWLKTEDSVHAYILMDLLIENDFSQQLKEYKGLQKFVSDSFKERFREEYKDRIEEDPSFAEMEKYFD